MATDASGGDAKLYGVILEWNAVEHVDKDGNRITQRPPTKWYRWLRNLTGMAVRTDARGDGIVARMNPGGYGVIVQEGCIICGSYSLARTIATFAARGLRDTDGSVIRPDAVHLVEMAHLDMDMTEADRRALNAMRETFGKRGRRKGDPVIWSVACMEDLATYQTESYHAINCPHCGGMQVRARVGEMLYLADPGGPVVDAWMRTRFATGQWEPARPGTDAAPANVTIKNAPEQAFVSKLANASVVAQIANLDRDKAMELLDAILVARLYWSDERRMKARIEAATRFFQMGGSPTDVLLAESPNDFDVLDAAGPLGAHYVATLLYRHVQAKAGNAHAVTVPDRQVDAPVLTMAAA